MERKNYTDEEILQNEEYARQLKARLKKLGISQAELAKALGRDQKTISNYLNAAFIIKSDTKALIEAYLDKIDKAKEFRVLSDADFSNMLNALIAEFGLTQKKLADEVSLSQKDISIYCAFYDNKKEDKREPGKSAKAQWCILNYFYSLCKTVNGEYPTRHYTTALYLDYLLHGKNSSTETVILRKKIKKTVKIKGKEITREIYDFNHDEENAYNLIEELDDINKCISADRKRRYSSYIENIASFPDDKLLLVINHFEAFCDSFHNRFNRLRDSIEILRNLSYEKKERLKRILERRSILKFPETKAEWKFFRLITVYRSVISDDNPLSAEIPCFNDVCEKLEILCDSNFVNAWDVEAEASFKCDMTKEEWYMWMLFLIYEFKGNDIYSLCVEMKNSL